MKFCLFHLMPYAPLDLTFDEKYPSSWMALRYGLVSAHDL